MSSRGCWAVLFFLFFDFLLLLGDCCVGGVSRSSFLKGDGKLEIDAFGDFEVAVIGIAGRWYCGLDVEGDCWSC